MRVECLSIFHCASLLASPFPASSLPPLPPTPHTHPPPFLVYFCRYYAGLCTCSNRGIYLLGSAKVTYMSISSMVQDPLEAHFAMSVSLTGCLMAPSAAWTLTTAEPYSDVQFWSSGRGGCCGIVILGEPQAESFATSSFFFNLLLVLAVGATFMAGLCLADRRAATISPSQSASPSSQPSQPFRYRTPCPATRSPLYPHPSCPTALSTTGVGRCSRATR